MNKYLHPFYGYPAAVAAFAGALLRCGRGLGLDHRPLQEFSVPEDFFGVNVAPGESLETSDYIVERLLELGIRQVRMDYSYGSPGGAAQALLDRLLALDFHVFINVFPPMSEAEALIDDVQAQQRWSRFLHALFADYSAKVACFEVGNTPNRGRWSGFSSRAFLMAWYLAGKAARERNIELAGPNVSDFEPLYNATYLALMEKLTPVPGTHTDNLFVERVVEPEAYDHRVAGRLATSLMKLNLIKKARILQAIGAASSVDKLVCTYTCWTSKRLARRSAWPEQKQVDYLVRYYALAVSSGALERVYWGPLVCHRDGLIDDGAEDYPAIDQVSFYERVRGSPAQFRVTPAYAALAYCARRLAGARCTSVAHNPQGASLFAFRSRDDQFFLLGWCRDGQVCPLDTILAQEELENAIFHDARGIGIAAPVSLTEQPVYIDLPRPSRAALPVPVKKAATTHLCDPLWQSADTDDGQWSGACMLRREHQQTDLPLYAELHPSRIKQLPETRVLRDARNRLWNVADPRGFGGELTIKLNRTRGIKRLTYRFRPSKGRRHWNNAVQMLRRGVRTPQPVAFHEHRVRSGVRDSWYVCEFLPDAFSARDVYAAFREGADSFHGLDKPAWFELLSGFVCHMHDKQVIHRDLSAGNLMLYRDYQGVLTPLAIDIGRAWIWSGPGSRVRERHRLIDLMRICYKLDWEDRQEFVACYEQHLGKALSPLWRLPFIYYDTKQNIKKTLKGKHRKR